MATITEKEDGPLIVESVETFEGPDGPIEVRPRMALCRCGQSSKKPFCDGTHREIGFEQRSEGVKGGPSGKDEMRAYEGADVTVHYNPRICSHAARCVQMLPEVFKPGRDPWIEPDRASVSAVRDAVEACPSGALKLPQGHLEARSRAEITVEKDGPYWVQGPDLIGDQGRPGEGGTEAKYVLCRCGLSGNKPYCDGSHHGAEWSDEG